jgi:hypothetical protein
MLNVVFRYQVESEPDEIAARAEAPLLEQTVELSRAVTRDPWVRENILGEVLSIEEIAAGLYAVALAQPLRAKRARHLSSRCICSRTWRMSATRRAWSSTRRRPRINS